MVMMADRSDHGAVPFSLQKEREERCRERRRKKKKKVEEEMVHG